MLTCVADHVLTAEHKGVDLGVVCADAARVLGVPNDLRILFGNLIENAVRYTPSGGIVDVAIRVLGDGVAVEIADTGCGIKQEALPRIFDRFFRAAPPDIEGTGLGLAICLAIATRHHLNIALTNRESGSGLVATVTGRLSP